MNYAEAVRYLLSLGHETLALKLGLTNISLLLERLGNPQQQYRVVQIAGTNGKGSTAAMLHSICTAAGIKAGLFTSPHLLSITERIRLGADEITEDCFAQCASRVRTAVEDLLKTASLDAAPTYFEQVTAIALLAFAESACDLAILETGLGGRLDATSAAGAKIVGITSISIDHQEHLGQTIEEIAGEKAAIIRSGTKAVVAKQDQPVMNVINDRAKQAGVALPVVIPEPEVMDFTTEGNAITTFATPQDHYEGVRLSLRGRHQTANAGVAILLAESLRDDGLNIRREAIIHGLEHATHPGRLELIDARPRVLLDGAHNVAGAEVLRSYLEDFVTTPITMVFGAMREKQLREMAGLLFPLARQLVLTAPSSPRAASIDDLRNIATEFLSETRIATIVPSGKALKAAFDITAADQLICVAGSLYLIGEVRHQLIEDRTSK